MEQKLLDIFKKWDESKQQRRSSKHVLKNPVSIKDSDSIYILSVKKLINDRISLNLSQANLADGLGLNVNTIDAFENYKVGENWALVFAARYLLDRYQEYIWATKGLNYYSPWFQ